MKKIAGKIAMFLVLVMLTGSLTGCSLLVDAMVQSAIDAAEEGQHQRAAKIVIQYDETDTF